MSTAEQQVHTLALAGKGLAVESPDGDEPIVIAGVDREVSVRDVIAWALENRPDLVAAATITAFGDNPCQPGLELRKCAGCAGSGIERS